MQPNYPHDSDGDALRRVAAHGSYMSQPMLIEFPVVVATESAAKEFSAIAEGQGFKVHLWKHYDDPNWDVICAVDMVATYPEVVRIQQQLTEMASPFCGIL